MGEIEYLRDRIIEVHAKIKDYNSRELEVWDEVNLENLKKEFVKLHSIANMVCKYKNLSFEKYIGA
jgi:hypothetical protein